MQQILFSVKDTKANFFAPPFVKNTRGEAERDFQMLVNDPKSNVHRFPKDYDLYEMGVYSAVEGRILPHQDGPRHLVCAMDLIDKELSTKLG